MLKRRKNTAPEKSKQLIKSDVKHVKCEFYRNKIHHKNPKSLEKAQDKTNPEPDNHLNGSTIAESPV